ncbi:TrmH family RNA methyltransferase [Candidatus Latescibacterota bacterium]
MAGDLQTAVILEDPKHPQNVGGALRACAAFGVRDLYWTGERVVFNTDRLPSQERMPHYQSSVHFTRDETALGRLTDRGFVPVAVEVKADAENLIYFEHPPKAVYVFGPEDGSLSKEALSACHRFAFIPTHYCLNLAAAVNVVLYDRRMKAMLSGAEPVLPLQELARPELPELAISGRIRDGFEGR